MNRQEINTYIFKTEQMYTQELPLCFVYFTEELRYRMPFVSGNLFDLPALTNFSVIFLGSGVNANFVHRFHAHYAVHLMLPSISVIQQFQC